MVWISERSARRNPGRRALHYKGRDWNYTDLQAAVESAAFRMNAMGIRQGDRVAFLARGVPSGGVASGAATFAYDFDGPGAGPHRVDWRVFGRALEYGSVWVPEPTFDEIGRAHV